MIGFCLAAGAGTRLLPLTRVTPKPLLAPAGRPLVDLAVEALQAAGASRVVVNAHHGAELLAAQLAGRPGIEVLVEPTLLGTGGGLVNAARLGRLGRADDPVLVTAADHVVTPADLAALAGFLDQTGAPMAAGLMPGPTSAPGPTTERVTTAPAPTRLPASSTTGPASTAAGSASAPSTTRTGPSPRPRTTRPGGSAYGQRPASSPADTASRRSRVPASATGPSNGRPASSPRSSSGPSTLPARLAGPGSSWHSSPARTA